MFINYIKIISKLKIKQYSYLQKNINFKFISQLQIVILIKDVNQLLLIIEKTINHFKSIFFRGTHGDKKGTAFVVYEDIYDAKNAFDNLSGFNVAGRYLIVLYYQPQKMQERQDLEFQKKQIEKLREQQRQQQQ